MAGSIVNTYGSTNTSLTNMQTVLDGTRQGFAAISLTNFSTTAVPAIAAGSRIEIGGSLYQFSTEEPISTTNVTSTSDCTWYIELVPSSSTVSAQFSTTIPAWREDYNGWYLSSSSPNRFSDYFVNTSSGTWPIKGKIFYNDNYQNTVICYMSTFFYTSTISVSTASVSSTRYKRILDPNGEYDVTTGLFSPKRKGVYEINYNCEYSLAIGGTSLYFYYYLDPSTGYGSYYRQVSAASTSDYLNATALSVTQIIPMTTTHVFKLLAASGNTSVSNIIRNENLIIKRIC